MTKSDSLEFGGLWNGLWYITLGFASVAIFVFYGDSVNIGGIVVSLVLVLLGVGAILAPRTAPLIAELHNYWTGLFWVLCGLGVLGIGVVSAGSGGRWIRGFVLGGGIIIYGILVAAGRQTDF